MSTKTLRRAQTITPFGVGSLVDVEGEGFVVQSIDKWPTIPQKLIKLDRLSRLIGNTVLRSFADAGSYAGPSSNGEALRVDRFPRWYHCSRCKKLSYVSRQLDLALDGNHPTCQEFTCKKQGMTPMRFVAYCDNGHLSEINWFNWCHRGGAATSGQCADKSQLYFHTSGKRGGDFGSMKISCKACNREENLTDIQRGQASPWVLQSHPAKGKKCSGRQPWQYPEAAVDCDQHMNIEPRGSSSIYRSKVITALDIEFLTPETTVEYPDLDTLFEFLLEENIPTKQLLIQEIKNPNGDHAARIQSRSARAGVSYEEGMDYLISKINSAELFKRTESKISEADPQEAIISGELQIFRDGKDVDSDNLRLRFFELTEEENGSIAKIVSSIGQVKRLREVRALASFIRGKGLAEVSVDQGASRTGWLPAIEAFGEGIYIELNKATLSEYFGIYGAAIDDCVHQQKAALKVMQDTYPLDYPDSPLFILTHTLSHLLIRQLTFNSGYSSSALRERLYIDSESQYAGILIYTTDTDSEGTLGGLVDQGRIEIITTVLRQIKESALWCSADPVCRETESQGFNNLNRSACHCCSLISETSCMYQNALLNRLTLGGMGSDREELLGFLEFAFGGNT